MSFNITDSYFKHFFLLISKKYAAPKLKILIFLDQKVAEKLRKLLQPWELVCQYGAKHFFRRKKSCILGAPLGEFWRSPNYWTLSQNLQTFSILGKILQCFLRSSLYSKMSLNITHSYSIDFLRLSSSKLLPPKLKNWGNFCCLGSSYVNMVRSTSSEENNLASWGHL